MSEELETKVENAEVQANAEVVAPAENKKDAKGSRKPRRENRRPEKVSDGLEKRMVSLNPITKVTKGGKTMRYDALMVVGDRNGKVGIGLAKALDVTQAIEKATLVAKKSMINVCIDGTTIPHDIIGKFGTTKVIMMPSQEGKGIIAGGAVRDVVELAGIRDITTKLYGSNNPVNCVKATFEGLKALRSAEQIAALRGKSVEEIR
ncbi:MAG: 30S ribosomal protein S5 [Clostridia bacterium]|nr:30S ribosomal protein S5 [Clostridia bacterium]